MFFIHIFDFKILNLFTVYPTQATYLLIGPPGLNWFRNLMELKVLKLDPIDIIGTVPRLGSIYFL